MKKIKFYSLVLLISMAPVFAIAQSTTFDPSYRFLHSNDLVQDKDFYFLTLLEKLPEVHKLVSNDQLFQQQLLKQKSMLQTAQGNSLDNTTLQYVSPFLWIKEENEAIENEFIDLFKKNIWGIQSIPVIFVNYFIICHRLCNNSLLK